MATFSDMIITNSGKAIYAKALSGKTINFSSAKLGNGTPESLAAAESLTDIVNLTAVASIASITSEDSVASITIEVKNDTFKIPVEVKEVGLFCIDPDTNEEVLYSYCYSASDIDVIPAITNGEVTWKMNLDLYISNATGTTTEQTGQENRNRAIYVEPTEPTDADGADGDVWLVYEE